MLSTERELLEFINQELLAHDRQMAKLTKDNSLEAAFHLGYIMALEMLAVRFHLPAIKATKQIQQGG